MKPGKFRWLWRILLIGLLLVLLVWAVKDVSFQETWQIISHLQAWQILALIALNCFIILLFSSRWWMLLRAYNQKIRFLNLVGYRQAAFSISYFTPGTQFGGEPFQVHLVQSRQGVSMPTAVASVTLDKLFELAGNFTFLALGALLVIVYGLLDGLPQAPIALAATVMLLVPILYLLAVARYKQPATRLAAWVACRWPHSTSIVRIQAIVTSSEDEIQCILREQPSLILIIALLSGLTWGAVLAEYWLMIAFLGERLSSAAGIGWIDCSPGIFSNPASRRDRCTGGESNFCHAGNGSGIFSWSVHWSVDSSQGFILWTGWPGASMDLHTVIVW